jgi:hypothetical protein
MMDIHYAEIFTPLQKVKQLYKERRAEEGPVVPMVKLMPGKEQITLGLDSSEETWIKDGWSLCPLSSFCVRKLLMGLFLGLPKFM